MRPSLSSPSRVAVTAALALSLGTPVLASAAGPASWWRGTNACPPGTVLKGAAPPHGADVGCAKRRSGVWHGRRTVWFDACTKAAPCNAAKAVRRYHGEYNRGIEHGHWVFWRRDGSKALEGEYYAGKRSGPWSTWDKQGKRGSMPNPVLQAKGASVDSAILDALRSAAANGKADLAAELEEASRDLKRGGRAATADNASRGRHKGKAIAPVRIAPDGSTHLDIPDLDMGATSFEGGDHAASPYVQKAAQQATQGVVRCYQQARRQRPGLAGELVARYEIEPSGRVLSVRIVSSDLTESMNQCVKRAIKAGVNLPPHESASAIEVITPWRFEAPGKGRKRR